MPRQLSVDDFILNSLALQVQKPISSPTIYWEDDKIASAIFKEKRSPLGK